MDSKLPKLTTKHIACLASVAAAGAFTLFLLNKKRHSKEREDKEQPKAKAPLTFGLNGKIVQIPASEVDPSVTLVEYIRGCTSFRGTKVSCAEGGCGACTVVLSRCEADGQIKNISVPSCMTMLPQVDGWAVTTTEGLKGGNFHPVQERIAELSGLQCGYCTPGFVMAIYGALKSRQAVNNNGLTMQEIEGLLDGNICRCTGYRPILDTAKSFAKDQNIGEQYGPYDSALDPTFPADLRNHQLEQLNFSVNGTSWIRPTSLRELFATISTVEADKRVKFVAGNTGRAFEQLTPDVYIDITRIPEFRVVQLEQGGLRVGGTTAINCLIEILGAYDDRSASFGPIRASAQRIAGTHVRNMGTIAGNLMLAKTIGFLSDLATSFLGAGAVIRLVSSLGSHHDVSIETFLENPSMRRTELLESVFLPFVKKGDVFRTYKAAIRKQNAHAYVNASLHLQVNGENTITGSVLAFGGIVYGSPGNHALRAKKTEAFLVGKKVNGETLQGASRVLKEELIPVGHKQEYRHRLVLGFFYKFFLSAVADLKKQKADLVSATGPYVRAVTTSHREFVYGKEHAPVSEPIPEVSGKLKAAGEAEFSGDVPDRPGTLYAAHILSPITKGKIVSVDKSLTLAVPGVWGTVGPRDLRTGGTNSNTWGPEPDDVFTESPLYHGQSLGLVLADTWQHALEGARKAIIVSKEDDDAVVTVSQAKEIFKQQLSGTGEPAIRFAKQSSKVGEGGAKDGQDQHHVSGTVVQASQQHFYMETQTSYVIPEEGGKYTVYCSNQFPGHVTVAVANVLGVKQSDVNVINRRCGGGFGGKLHHHVRQAAAAAVAAAVSGRPVKLVLNRATDSRQCGGREEAETDYRISFNHEGVVSCAKLETHTLSGFTNGLSWFANVVIANGSNQCYKFPNYEHHAHLLKANLPSRTAMRAPGDVESSYIAENIIDHVAQALGLSPEVVRERNFFSFDPNADEKAMKLPAGDHITHWTIPRLWPLCKEQAKYDELRQQADDFNAHNRWRKRGVAVTPVRYQVTVFTRQAIVNIYADGSVLVTQDGAEIGQGLYTKVIQTASYALGKLLGTSLPIESINIGDVATYITPNIGFTGGSTGSEGACEAVAKACAELVERLKPVAETYSAINDKEPTWADVCSSAAQENIHLSALAQVRGAGHESLSYQNYGVALSQVELDVLTGEVEVERVHMVYDCGKSLNPIIDIGQAEGAYVMGLGYYLTEEVRIGKDGELLSPNTWDYKPPGVRDIPQNFSVTFLQDTKFDKGFLSSKCSGEPPLCLATSTIMAVKDAIYAARADAGLTGFFPLPVPATPAVIAELCGHDLSQLTL